MAKRKALVRLWEGTDYLDEGPRYPYHDVRLEVTKYDIPEDPEVVEAFEVKYKDALVFRARGLVEDRPTGDTVLHMVIRVGPRQYQRFWVDQLSQYPVDFKVIQYALWLWLRDSFRSAPVDKLCITNVSLATKETWRGLGLYGRNGREVIGWVKDGRFSVARAQPYWLRQGIESLYPALIADTNFVDEVGGREDLKPII